MAHLIEEHDNMVSANGVVPWHGLGVVLEDYPTIEEAKDASGLTWTASIRPSYYEVEDGSFARIQGTNAVIRDDVKVCIGSVGDRYEIYQNDEMWQFIETFQMFTKCKIETAGSLRNGAVAWVLAKNGTAEYVTGDPIEEYFLFRNSFDGSSPIMTMFTNIRVVCHNTMSLALRDSRNIFKVRHTTSAEQQLPEVQKALGLREQYRIKFGEAMEHLKSFQLKGSEISNILETVIFPMPKQIVQEGGKVTDIVEASQKAMTARKNKIEAVTKLIDTGKGTDIANVVGTGYGLYQALVEWADHGKSIKVTKNRSREEVKFENVFWGTAANFKQDCFDALIQMA